MCMQADISKIKAIGWEPQVSIKDGIKKTVNGAMKND